MNLIELENTKISFSSKKLVIVDGNKNTEKNRKDYIDSKKSNKSKDSKISKKSDESKHSKKFNDS